MQLSTSEEMTEPAESVLEQMNEYSHLDEIEERALESEYSFDREFEFGLELILDALDRTAR